MSFPNISDGNGGTRQMTEQEIQTVQANARKYITHKAVELNPAIEQAAGIGVDMSLFISNTGNTDRIQVCFKDTSINGVADAIAAAEAKTKKPIAMRKYIAFYRHVGTMTQGFGNCPVEFDGTLTFDQFRKLEQHIKEKYFALGDSSIVITGLHPLEEETIDNDLIETSPVYVGSRKPRTIHITINKLLENLEVIGPIYSDSVKKDIATIISRIIGDNDELTIITQ